MYKIWEYFEKGQVIARIGPVFELSITKSEMEGTFGVHIFIYIYIFHVTMKWRAWCNLWNTIKKFIKTDLSNSYFKWLFVQNLCIVP